MPADRPTDALPGAAGASTEPIKLPGGVTRKIEARTGTTPGQEQIGPYRLLGKVGEGGMGVVYKALDRRDRVVAIKVLRAHIAYDSGARERLRREVTTLSLVRSSRIGWVLDADVDGDRPYLVTRYVSGPPLDAVIDESGPMDAGRLARLGQGMAEALRDIHRAGIVHRDLKPGNVLMDGDEPVLIDFGIAHVADETRLTSTGLVMGTPGYLSPEIVEGGEVTEATDWWGWAATLAFAASGAAPFGRGPMHAVLDRVSDGRADLSRVDPRMQPLLAAALSPDPSDRPSATQVLEQLHVYASGGHTTGISVRPAGANGRTTGAPATGPERPALGQLAAAPVRDGRPTPTRRPAYDERPVAGRPEPDRSNAAAARRQPARPADRAPVVTDRHTSGASAYDAYAGARPSHVDPRIGQPARTRTLAAMTAAVVGVAAALPVLAVIMVFLWSFAARWSDRAVTSMVLRRYNSGRRKSDSLVAVASSPWHAVVAALSTLLTMIIPFFVGVCVAAATAVAINLATQQRAEIGRPLPMALAALAGCTVLWWGPGSAGMRRGSRSIVRSVAREVPVTRVLVALCVAVAVLGVLWAVGSGADHVNWFPYADSAQLPLADVLPSLPGS